MLLKDELSGDTDVLEYSSQSILSAEKLWSLAKNKERTCGCEKQRYDWTTKETSALPNKGH